MHSGARCSLTLLDACTEDCGTYTCIAGNSVAQTSCHAKLTVDAGESQQQPCILQFVKHTCGLLYLKTTYCRNVEAMMCFSGPEDIEEEVEVEFTKRRKLLSVYDVCEEIGR